MKFENGTLYIWTAGSCDYAHKERAGGGAYIAEYNGNTVDTYTCTQFDTTEFRMILTSIIHALEKFSDTNKDYSRIVVLSNVQYLQNIDRTPDEKAANADLMEQCTSLKKYFEEVTVKVVPYRKYPKLTEVHKMASDAMRKIRLK